jgi:hypothetical protein
MKKNEKEAIHNSRIVETIFMSLKYISEFYKRVRIIGIFVLLFVVNGIINAEAEEITATILFEPRKDPTYNRYTYSLDTTGNKVADKRTEIGYSNVGNAINTLPDYLVKGAKIVYENEGMKNEVGGSVNPNRFIAIITEDGTYIELDQLVSSLDIGRHFDYLYKKLKHEGR